MELTQQDLARREMNIYLRDRGITQRSLALIDAVIALFISLDP